MNVLPMELWKDLMDRFDSIYNNGTKEIQRNLDQYHIGNNGNSLPKNNGQSELNIEKRPKVFGETSKKWKAMMDDIAKNGDQWNKDEHSPSSLRLSFVMDLFREHFLEQIVYAQDDNESADSQYLDLFAHCLSDYDSVSLLNDFDGIQSKNGINIGNKLKNCKMPGPRSQCSRALRLLRTRRDSANQMVEDAQATLQNFNNSMDNKRFILLEITIKIHMYFNHSKSDEKEDEMKDQLDTESAADQTVSKFVNEMDIAVQMGQKQTKMDKLQSVAMRGGATTSGCVNLSKWLIAERFDTEAIRDDVSGAMTLDAAADSNIFRTLNGQPNQRMRIVKQILLYLNALNSFTFGFDSFRHWKYFEGGHDYVQSPKYSNLKEESLNNEIHSIPITTFHQILNKAIVHQKSNTAKKKRAIDSGNENSKYEVPANSPLSVSHILVVIMYTDLDQLQNEYKKKGCRESTEIQSVDDPAYLELKDHHREIGWWYKLIVECVLFWGTVASPQSTYYTGLNCPLVFDSLSPTFLCPFSTTTSIEIAHRFSKAQGLILEMKPSVDSDDYCLDVEWVSCFPEEQERLFVQALKLQIVDIKTFDDEKQVVSNEKFVRSFALFCSLFQGRFIWPILQKKKKRTEEILLSLIRQYKYDTVVDSDENSVAPKSTFSFFVEQMFNNLMDKFRKTMEFKYIYLIKSEFDLLGEPLRMELMQFGDGNMMKSEDQFKISPFLSSLNCRESDIIIMKEFIWSLDEEELSTFKQTAAGQELKSQEEFVYRINDGETVTFKMEAIRKISGSKFVGFGFNIVTSSVGSVSGRFSVEIKEAEWFLNECNFYDVSEDGYVSKFAFEDNLVDGLASMTVRFAVHFQGEEEEDDSEQDDEEEESDETEEDDD